MSYTFSLSRRSLPVRCLCLLLIVLVLWCFFMVPRAGAVAVEAATVAYAGALVGTILVGAGVIFSSHGDMQKVGAAMYKSWIKSSNAIGSKISAIAAWAVEHGEAAAKGALRVGKDLYQSIVDAFNASYSDGNFLINDYFDTITTSNGRAFCDAFNNMRVSEVDLAFDSGDVWSLRLEETKKGYGRIDWYINKVWKDRQIIDSSNFWDYSIYLHIDRDYGTLSFCFGSFYSGDHVSSCGDFVGMERAPAVVSTSVPIQVGSVPVPQPDLAYPSDNTLVRMPDIPSVDTDTGEAVFPADAAYTKDAVSVPYPTDADGVKVPDIPYDKVVDQSTGKALDDTGTDTDNPSKPGEGTDTGSNTGLLQKILDLLKNFFDSPSDFRLNMDGFRNLAIKDKFPFCIPFDMVDSVKQFAADAADYQFRVKLDTQYFKVDHVVDLTPLAVPLAFFRYLVVAWFAWVLMSRTHDLMKW